MKTCYKKAWILLMLAAVFFEGRAQKVNLALTATASHSSGGATNYGPQNYNDGIIPAYGSGIFGWVNDNASIEFVWTSPQDVAKIKIFSEYRPLTGFTLQYWNGSAYTNILTYTSSIAMPVEDSISFPLVSTTKIRLFNCVSSVYNPNMREIEIFGPDFQNDVSAAISKKLDNTLSCGNEDITVLVTNHGTQPQSNFMVGATYTVGNTTGYLTAQYTGTLLPNRTDSLVVGSLATLPTGFYALNAYTLLSTDENTKNDTSGTANFSTLPPVATPDAVSDSVCAGESVTLKVLSNNSNAVHKWYSALSGGTAIFTGDSLSFSSITQDTVLYVSAKVANCESSRVPIRGVLGNPPVVDLGPDTSFCQSQPLVLDAGNPGGTYRWSNGANTQSITLTSQSGTYWVVVDKYCIASDTINISISPLPVISGISYVRMANTYHFNASSAIHATSYFWDFGDGNTSTLPNPVHTYSSAVDVESTVKLFAFNDCGADSSFRTVPTSIQNINAADAQVKVYPNPAGSAVKVETGRIRPEEILIVNMQGALVFRTQELQPQINTLDISGLVPGMYIVKIRAKEKNFNLPLEVLK